MRYETEHLGLDVVINDAFQLLVQKIKCDDECGNEHRTCGVLNYTALEQLQEPVYSKFR